MFGRRLYSLAKMRHVYHTQYRWYKKSALRLPENVRSDLERHLESLNTAIQDTDREQGTQASHALEALAEEHHKHSIFHYCWEIALALVIALSVATVIRQTWFELYEIPSGSMRPTFRELDRLIVTKTSLGLNVPLEPGHLYFNDDNVQRTGVVIWSGEGIDLPDTDAMYFGVIPSKKRYIKRLMGKPGDHVYFYGGQVWCVDKDGERVTAYQDAEWMQNLDYVPFGTFDGRPSIVNTDSERILTFKHFNIPIAKMQVQSNNTATRQVWNGSDWVDETPANAGDLAITEFGQHWGIDNYGQARILTKEQLAKTAEQTPAADADVIAYLQIAHHPSLTYPEPRLMQTTTGEVIPALTPYDTVFPLHQRHLDAIRSNLYTARFQVVQGRAVRYSTEGPNMPRRDSIKLPGTPDGRYEFYDGVGYSVGFGGNLEELAEDHPLMSSDLSTVQALFNFGIEFRSYLDVDRIVNAPYPSRYTYFRDGALYAGRGPIAQADDAVLQAFVAKESERAAAGSQTRRYRPFIDAGAPSKEMVLARGVKVPDAHYLVLGDNHAMSADSRYFGFVPEANMEGSPSVIIWPWQDRMGAPSQAPYPWVTLPRVIIWALILGLVIGWRLYSRRRDEQPFERIEAAS